MRCKKLLSVIIVFAMVFSFMPSLVRAEETDIASAGTAEELATALAAGGTFTSHFDTVSPVELSSGATITGGTYLTHSGNPSTGDGFDMGMMFVTLVVSAAAIVVLSSKKRFVK